MSRSGSSRILLILTLALFAAPSRAWAQWYAGISFGGNHTQKSTVTVEAPAQGVSLQFHDVRYSARPFSAPAYYDWRVGKVFKKMERFTLALELEFIHLKVIADTARTYVITPGASGGGFVTMTDRMDTTVQRYQMTHGLNFALVNVVARAPLPHVAHGRLALDLRAGAGPTIPHAETTVLGVSKEQYESGGIGLGGAVGLEMKVSSRVNLLGEYKVTFARPHIDLAQGTGRMSAVTHQFTGGVLIRLTR